MLRYLALGLASSSETFVHDGEIELRLGIAALGRADRGAAADQGSIWGERDATAYPHVAERKRILQSIQPGARFTIVPGAGHWVQFEEADAFNRIITEYVG
jgi:pimeloyl-ACP methyl ester carboxylesterase